MDYQLSMKCYDCKRSGSLIRFISRQKKNTVIGCKICNNKIRVPLPERIYESSIEKTAHIFAVCYRKT